MKLDVTASEIRSGAFVTLSGIALLGLLFMAGNTHPLKDTQPVQILFHYIGGLEKNAPVHFAGHEVGRITDIQIQSHSEVQVLVTAQISKTVILRKDSQALIDVLGFMGEKLVELTPGSPEASLLGPDEKVRGVDPILLPILMKRAAELVEDLNRTNDSVKTLVADLHQMVGENRTDLRGILKNLNESSGNLKEMTQDLKVHPWKLLRKGKEKKPVEEKKPSHSS